MSDINQKIKKFVLNKNFDFVGIRKISMKNIKVSGPEDMGIKLDKFERSYAAAIIDTFLQWQYINSEEGYGKFIDWRNKFNLDNK